MALKPNARTWSMKRRELIALSKTHTLEAIADQLQRSPELILKRETWLVNPASESEMKRGPRPKRRKGTWYVSFESKERLLGQRAHPRVTEPFRNEQEAKAFAKTKLAAGLNVSAGTLNPHLPKRTIPSAQMLNWSSVKKPE
jgi:hypothetical protein